jgi:hypothetical protein
MLRIKTKLSFKVGQREQIDRRLEALGKTIAEEQKRIKCCISVLKNANGLYEKTEYDLCGISAPNIVQHSHIVDGKDAEAALWDVVRRSAKITGKYGGSASGKLSDAALTYVKTLYEFFTGEKRGGERG